MYFLNKYKVLLCWRLFAKRVHDLIADFVETIEFTKEVLENLIITGHRFWKSTLKQRFVVLQYLLKVYQRRITESMRKILIIFLLLVDAVTPYIFRDSLVPPLRIL